MADATLHGHVRHQYTDIFKHYICEHFQWTFSELDFRGKHPSTCNNTFFPSSPRK